MISLSFVIFPVNVWCFSQGVGGHVGRYLWMGPRPSSPALLPEGAGRVTRMFPKNLSCSNLSCPDFVNPVVPSPSGRRAGNEDNATVRQICPHYRNGLFYAGFVTQARELRKNQTEAERIFWHHVRNRKFMGLKFRRQHQIGFHIVDFYCHYHHLIIELDGGYHDTIEQKILDAERDASLQLSGFVILRFTNEQVIDLSEQVLATIKSSFMVES